jgi:hypothetical protein
VPHPFRVFQRNGWDIYKVQVYRILENALSAWALDCEAGIPPGHMGVCCYRSAKPDDFNQELAENEQVEKFPSDPPVTSASGMVFLIGIRRAKDEPSRYG